MDTKASADNSIMPTQKQQIWKWC